MSSQIDITKINQNFPIAGIDNDTQGFRDNFAAIKLGLATARAEITNIQNSNNSGGSDTPTDITAINGDFNSLSVSVGISGDGFVKFMESPPSIGTVLPSSGNFTTITSSYNITNNLIISNETAQSNYDGAIWLNGSSGTIMMDNSANKRISWNDGDGDLNIRSGNLFNGFSNVYLKNKTESIGGASGISMFSDTVDGSIKLMVAPRGSGAIDYTNDGNIISLLTNTTQFIKPILLPNGTSQKPSISFTANTGLYRGADDSINFTNNAIRTGTISSGGSLSMYGDVSSISDSARFNLISRNSSNWYNAMFKNNGTTVSLTYTNPMSSSGAALVAGSNDYCPFMWDLSDNKVYIDNGISKGGTTIGGSLVVNDTTDFKSMVTMSDSSANLSNNGALWLNGDSGTIMFDVSGHKRITWNDGISDFAIRCGNMYDGSSLVYSKKNNDSDGGSANIVLRSDTKDGTIELNVSKIGSSETAVSVDNAVIIDKNKTSFSKPIFVPNGTATNPSIVFSSDINADTGLFNTTDGVIRFSNNGVESGKITTGGHLSVSGNITSASYSNIIGGSGSNWAKSSFYNDGSHAYLLSSNIVTSQNNALTATYSTKRPFYWDIATGAVYIDNPSVSESPSGTVFGGNVTIGQDLVVTGSLNVGENIITFMPIEQGGGVKQLSSNKINIGWTGSDLRATLDGTDIGTLLGIGGFGQSYQKFTIGDDPVLQRKAGVSYYNGTGRPIIVVVGVSQLSDWLSTIVAQINNSISFTVTDTATGSVLITPGQYYKLTSGGEEFTSWIELRTN